MLQVNAAIGLFVCMIVMLGIYYGNGWNAQSQPFMSTKLRTAAGGKYPVGKVFVGGVLSQQALAQYGIPQLSGTFAYAMFMANAAIGALIVHVIIFWGKDIVKSVREARAGASGDKHHQHMVEHYKDCPWYWYAGCLLISFVLGLVVVIKENITLPWWAYIIALLLGSFIAPFVSGTRFVISKLQKLIV